MIHRYFLGLLVMIHVIPVLGQWTLMNSGTTETIDDIYFLNEFVGYGVTSGSIIETIDGGFNWSVVHTFESTVWLDRSIVTTPDSVYCFAASINGDPFK